MQGIVFAGNRQVEMREFPDPTPGPGEVVLEIKASGMCGSDLHNYRATPQPGGAVTEIVYALDAGKVRALGWKPAHAFPAVAGSETGSLPQRDFDLGRGWGFPPSGGPAAPVPMRAPRCAACAPKTWR